MFINVTYRIASQHSNLSGTKATQQSNFEHVNVHSSDISIKYGVSNVGDWLEHSHDTHDKYLIFIFLESEGEAELSWRSVKGRTSSRRICGPHICTVGAKVALSVRWVRPAAFVALLVSEKFVGRNGSRETMAGVSIAPTHEYAGNEIGIHHFNEHFAKLCRNENPPPHDYVHGLGLAQASQMLLARSRAACGKNPPALPAAQLEKVNRHIAENLSNRIPVDELARIAGVGVDQFTRLFKRAVGRTPHQHVIHCRLTHAQRLAAEGNLRKGEIAAETGFTDQSHLRRSIRRMCAKT